MPNKRVAIVGGGCSGLTATKSCIEGGLEPICFERESDIGGLWNYSDEPVHGKGSIYKNLVINTSKEMMAFSDFPTPEEFPPFMPHSDVLKYFKLYASHFELLRHIKFQTSVLFIEQSSDYEETGRWLVRYQTQDDEPQEEVFDAVMICSGHHTVPHQPHFHGLEKFQGAAIHSHAYREASKFKGQRVVVVGIGNSAVDIAVDISKVTEQVFTSTRRGAWVIGRTGFWGLPADLLANNRFLFSLPRGLLGWVVEKQANLRIDHQRYGLKPKHGALAAHPTINDEIPYHMMTGKIRVKQNINEFTENGAYFTDGSYERIDSVIFATGYDYQLKFIDHKVLTIDENQVNLYKYVFPPKLKHSTLGVIGLIQAVGAVMPISEIQSRWFVQLLKGNCKLPSNKVMLNDIKRNTVEMNEGYVSTRRHTIQAFWVDYMDEIASFIGCKPNFWKLAVRDPELALRCHFGPCVPAQYRLQGPNKWSGAREIIRNALSRATNCSTITKQPAESRNEKYFKAEHSKLMTLSIVMFVFLAWLTKVLVTVL
ncbi:hypothetical protein LOTGIDRAFT_221976 [Lottia gigantea]|uniref:Flavin-containing monooxygenase n=1 Tax=Lottia gigantea TaxID=225164 RepID=V3ZK80_LOTGI|nr:hypothetical protein LOTGIDRAFT_221976 [Lottia gigantea]ESO84662.1 hypothetical protein LOTGIDRAFT_221976 [Lottia gigantea]